MKYNKIFRSFLRVCALVDQRKMVHNRFFTLIILFDEAINRAEVQITIEQKHLIVVISDPTDQIASFQ